MKIQKTKVQKETSVSYAKKAALTAALGLSMSVFSSSSSDTAYVELPADPNKPVEK